MIYLSIVYQLRKRKNKSLKERVQKAIKLYWNDNKKLDPCIVRRMKKKKKNKKRRKKKKGKKNSIFQEAPKRDIIESYSWSYWLSKFSYIKDVPLFFSHLRIFDFLRESFWFEFNSYILMYSIVVTSNIILHCWIISECSR